MATQKQLEQAAERARKEKVDQYKKAVEQMEEDEKLFYENSLKRQQISEAEFAASLKERSERFAQYSKEVMEISYMTEQEKYDISREFLIKSEKALTDHFLLVKKLQEQSVADSLKNSESYVSDRNYYDNWAELGDDPISAFARVDKNLSEQVFGGVLSHEDYHKKLSQFGAQMYADRIENSNRWLAHETEMNRLSTAQYIEGLERMKAYTQSYYGAGIISHRQYTDGMQSLEERIFEKKKQQHKEILAQAEEEKAAVDRAAAARIEALEAQYSSRLSAIDEENEEQELKQLKAQEKVYKNAETREGKERLADIRERIDYINDNRERKELKESFNASKSSVLKKATARKHEIDSEAAGKALDLGLYYNEASGYKMLSDVKKTFTSVLSEQTAFSVKSKNEIALYNTELNQLMNESARVITENLLTSFAAFATGVNAIKNQIYNDVASVNALDFSRFGARKPIKTSITYNDYGDKNITGINQAADYFSGIGNLLAKGGSF